MRKLMIVAGALATVMSLGAMRTASAETAYPASTATTLPPVAYTSHLADNARKHRRQEMPTRRTATDRNARRDQDAGGSRATPHSVPSRVSDPRGGQWSGYQYGRANDHQAPTRVSAHDVRTPVRQPSPNSPSSHGKNDRSRESARGDRG